MEVSTEKTEKTKENSILEIYDEEGDEDKLSVNSLKMSESNIKEVKDPEKLGNFASKNPNNFKNTLSLIKKEKESKSKSSRNNVNFSSESELSLESQGKKGQNLREKYIGNKRKREGNGRKLSGKEGSSGCGIIRNIFENIIQQVSVECLINNFFDNCVGDRSTIKKLRSIIGFLVDKFGDKKIKRFLIESKFYPKKTGGNYFASEKNSRLYSRGKNLMQIQDFIGKDDITPSFSAENSSRKSIDNRGNSYYSSYESYSEGDNSKDEDYNPNSYESRSKGKSKKSESRKY